MKGTEPLEAQRAEYTHALAEAVERIKPILSRKPEVEPVVLFGSYAKGRRDLLTDLDVLVVMSSDKPFVERIAELYRELHVPVDMDLVCYTPGSSRTCGIPRLWCGRFGGVVLL